MAFKNPVNFFKKANRSFNIYLENYKNKNSKIDDLLKDQEKFNALLGALIDIYGENQRKTDEILDSYDPVGEDLKNAIINYNKNYDNSRKYFFNGEEHLFKNMDTDKFFQMCSFNDIKLLSHSPRENKILLETGEGIKLITNNRYYTVEEIFARNGYSAPLLHQLKEFVVFDIGMNRGYASLKFANFDSCKAVYGFEIDDDIYKFALENFNLNPSLNHKIKPYNFGLSNKNAEVDIYTLPGCDGVTTTELELTEVIGEWPYRKDQMEIKKARVKEAGVVISDIIEEDEINSPIVLKIDTEGSEYKIIDSLIGKGVMDKVDLIMGEIHFENQDLDDKLAGFENIGREYHNDTGHGFIYLKDKLYNPLHP
ncbi:MAG TPA: FkbM family methyltransferase [Methanobacterium sp.]|nr:FkbM family methyltransferase [Methanobacterium sp.]